jgi:hypothetical protein
MYFINEIRSDLFLDHLEPCIYIDFSHLKWLWRWLTKNSLSTFLDWLAQQAVYALSFLVKILFLQNTWTCHENLTLLPDQIQLYFNVPVIIAWPTVTNPRPIHGYMSSVPILAETFIFIRLNRILKDYMNFVAPLLHYMVSIVLAKQGLNAPGNEIILHLSPLRKKVYLLEQTNLNCFPSLGSTNSF